MSASWPGEPVPWRRPRSVHANKSTNSTNSTTPTVVPINACQFSKIEFTALSLVTLTIGQTLTFWRFLADVGIKNRNSMAIPMPNQWPNHLSSDALPLWNAIGLDGIIPLIYYSSLNFINITAVFDFIENDRNGDKLINLSLIYHCNQTW